MNGDLPAECSTYANRLENYKYMTLRSLDNLDLQNKVVLLRVDLNVPRLHGKVTDNTRILRAIPTIRYLQERNAKIVLLSHLGRPKGEFKREYSLAPITNELEKHLEQSILFCGESIGLRPKSKIENMSNGDILLLENLRFDAREERCDITFACELAELGDFYVNDTFSCSHRNHASITALAELLPSAAGLLLQSEIEAITAKLHSPEAPFTAIIGGAKISTKIELLKSLTQKADYMLLGGAMANSFLAAQGISVGKSLVERELIDTANEILRLAKERNCELILPSDVVTASALNSKECQISPVNNIAADQMILDIGPHSTANIKRIIAESHTLVWNGPLGAFEQPPFDVASNSITRAIAYHTTNDNLCSVAGGGDTLSAIKQNNLGDSFSYLSTGGGAFLEWLEGKELPGIAVLSAKI